MSTPDDGDGDRLTSHEHDLLASIAAADDPLMLAYLIDRYYADLDRANRTPRGHMYLHLGLLNGTIVRLLSVGTREKVSDGQQQH